MVKRQIREFVEGRKIPYLIHFTRNDNLTSIIQHGIYPVNRFDEIDTTPVINDQLRLDGHLDSVSVSIAFPNCQMFYKCRMEEPEVKWSILVLSPSILWEKNCAFCRYNAADGKISCQSLDTLKTPESLQGLFSEIETSQTRKAQCLKEFDPTDVQAEVLVFDIVEPDKILGVVFDSILTKDNFSGIVGNRKTFVHPANKKFFGTRSYARIYNQ